MISFTKSHKLKTKLNKESSEKNIAYYPYIELTTMMIFKMCLHPNAFLGIEAQ